MKTARLLLQDKGTKGEKGTRGTEGTRGTKEQREQRSPFSLCSLFFLFFLFAALTAQAATITVTSAADDGAGSLREALSLVNDDGDIIDFDFTAMGGSTITLSSWLDISKSVTIEGGGVTIDGNGSYNIHATIVGTDITIRRVRFTGGTGYMNNGGAIIHLNCSLTLQSCIFDNNSASYGGAIYSANGDMTVEGCTFYGNTATDNGGAIYLGGGDLTLTGNIFYGNTATSSESVYISSNNLTACNYNVYDVNNYGSGYDFRTTGTNNVQTPVPIIVPASFKPVDIGANIGRLPAALPGGYPTVDFAGAPIAGSGYVGAIQDIAIGLVLDYAAIGGGTVDFTDRTLTPDGLYGANTSVTLTANADAGASFLYWEVNGVKTASTAPNELTFTMTAHTTVRAVFSIQVTNLDDDGNGSLRQAIADAPDGSGITFKPGLQGTITLASELFIDKGLTIEGGGIILSGDHMTRIMNINASGKAVTLERLRFTAGIAFYGSAINQYRGDLTLRSCLFDGNDGTALDSYGYLTVEGCTFYGNTAPYTGGAIYLNGNDATLTGNIFYGNTAAGGGASIFNDDNATITSAYNVWDDNTGDDFDFGGTGDAQTTTLPLAPATFKPLSGGKAIGILPTTLPAGYPTVDFAGDAIIGGGHAGALQAIATGWLLDYAAIGSGAVAITTATGTLNTDGLYADGTSVTLTATAGAGNSFLYWTVDGQQTAGSPTDDVLTVTMTDHTTVRAVFTSIVTTLADDGAGSLREVIANTTDGATITFADAIKGGTITLASTLLIDKGLTIEGGGITFSGDQANGILYVYAPGKAVTLERLRFTAGQSVAIFHESGSLRLRSCIIDGNNETAALVSLDELTVEGCTFYGNTSTFAGGAIYLDWNTTATLTGNIFYGNTAAGGGASVYNDNATITSAYNVWDDNTDGNFYFGTDDVQSATASIDAATFAPFAGGPAIGILPATLPADYPTVDFAGAAITGGGQAGALQASIAAPPTVTEYVTVTVNLALVDPALRDHIGLNPVEGTTQVPKGQPFDFTLWFDNTTHLSSFTVWLNGQAIEPAQITAAQAPLAPTGGASLRAAIWESVYTYSIPSTADAYIEITGITWNDGKNPTGSLPNPSQGGALKAAATDGGLWITGLQEGQPLHIYNVRGQLVYKGTATAPELPVRLPAKGIYIVKNGGRTAKAVY